MIRKHTKSAISAIRGVFRGAAVLILSLLSAVMDGALSWMGPFSQFEFLHELIRSKVFFNVGLRT